MRYYEIVLMINIDQSDNINHIIENYKNIIQINNGIIHRLEDWGRRLLAYKIQNMQKAHYLLMNIQSDIQLIRKLENDFKFNNSIIRNIIISCKKIFQNPSPMLKVKDIDKKKSVFKNLKSQIK